MSSVTMSVDTDFPQVARMLSRIPDEIKRNTAMSMALNKVAAKGKTTASREIRKRYNLKASEVSMRLLISRSSKDRLTVVIQPQVGSRGRTQNVIRFIERKVSMATAKRRRKAGTLASVQYMRGIGVVRLHPYLYFQIRKGSAGKRINGSFIGNKGRTVFRRTGDARLPIEPVHTIDVPDMFGARVVMDETLKRINEELPIEVRRAVEVILKGIRK